MEETYTLPQAIHDLGTLDLKPGQYGILLRIVLDTYANGFDKGWTFGRQS